MAKRKKIIAISSLVSAFLLGIVAITFAFISNKEETPDSSIPNSDTILKEKVALDASHIEF